MTIQKQLEAESGDLIDQIFFSPPPLVEETDEEPQDVQQTGEVGDEEDLDAGGYSDGEDYVNTSTMRNTGRPNSSSSAPAPSLEDLQKAQREQMEEAIGLMASQMKEATKGIQSQIKQQTDRTLTELESTVEQNFEDVKQVTQNVQTHNQTRRTQNWGTFTMLFVIAGTFVFCMMTIWTVPKRPNTCLILCRGDGKDTSLIGWLGTPIWVMGRSALDSSRSLWDAYGADVWEEYGISNLFGIFGDDTAKEATDWKEPSKEWEQVYNDLEAEERQHKQELDQLLNSLNQQKVKEETGNHGAQKPKNDLASRKFPDLEDFKAYQPKAKTGKLPDVGAFGDYPPVKPKTTKQNEQQQQPPKATSDDNPFARSRFGDRKPKSNDSGGSNDPFGSGAVDATRATGSPKLSDEQRRVSPKDIRSAADQGDIAKLKERLELRPEFIDRTDKNGWGALHFAVRKGKSEAVRLLVDQGCSINPINKGGQTPLDLAARRLGPQHPIIGILQKAGGTSTVPIESPESSTKPNRSMDTNQGNESEDTKQSKDTKQVSRPRRLLIANENAVHPDESDSIDYVEKGRSKLDQLEAEPRRTSEDPMKLMSDTTDDVDKYVQRGRNRLDALLAKSGDKANARRDEL